MELINFIVNLAVWVAMLTAVFTLAKEIKALSNSTYHVARNLQSLKDSIKHVNIHVQYPEPVMKLIAIEAAEKLKVVKDELERRAGDANKKAPVKFTKKGKRPFRL